MGELSTQDFYKPVSEMLSVDFKQSWSTAGGFWKHGEVFLNRHIHAVIIWQILLIHFSPFQVHAWVTMLCTCITQPKSTHTMLFTVQVTKRLVICKLQLSIRQTAPKRMRADYCFNKLKYIWKSSNAHTITTLIFACAVIWYFQWIQAEVSLLFCKAMCTSAELRYSPGVLQPKVTLCLAVMERWHSLPPSSEQDEGLCHPWKTRTNTSAVTWTLIPVILARSLVQSHLLVLGSFCPGTSNLCWGQKQKPLPRQMCLYKQK